MLPIKTTVEDIKKVCAYLAGKSTGATITEAKAVVEGKHLDGRKLAAMKHWDLITQDGEKYKITPLGRQAVRGDFAGLSAVLKRVITNVPAYRAVIERVHHRKESSLTSVEIGAHWHEHFKDEVADKEVTLNLQAVCFLHLAEGAEYGSLLIGRRGQPTRFNFNQVDVDDSSGIGVEDVMGFNGDEGSNDDLEVEEKQEPADLPKREGKGIFIGHGKKHAALKELEKILSQFKVPYKIAQYEANLGRPIGQKVKETMESCNCAILLFTADEEFKDKEGNEVWRPSENVIHELGAASYVYGTRIVILKEDKVDLPSNVKDIGYISFTSDKLAEKAIDILKELIGFDIVRIST